MNSKRDLPQLARRSDWCQHASTKRALYCRKRDLLTLAWRSDWYEGGVTRRTTPMTAVGLLMRRLTTFPLTVDECGNFVGSDIIHAGECSWFGVGGGEGGRGEGFRSECGNFVGERHDPCGRGE